MIRIPDVGRGVNYDLTPEELEPGVWTAVQNMRFRDGYAQKFKGIKPVFEVPSVTPYYLTAYQTPTKKFWVHAGLQRVFADDGTTRTDITPASVFTGGVDDRWTGGTLGGVLVMNNGVDQPQFWGGNVANDLAPLTGWNANWRAGVIRPFKNYLVALDLTKSGTRYQHMVKWSHAAVAGTIPASWDETNVTLDAGEQDLAETSDALVDALPLGDSLIVYKERSMYSMTYIGQPYIWRFQRLPGDSGMLARGCGAVTPLGHVVLTAGDVVLNTGSGVQSIANGTVRRFIFQNIDSTNYRRAFVTTNPQRNEVLVCFPLSGSTVCDKAAVWNWETKTWGMRDLNSVTYGATGLLDGAATDTWSSDPESWYSDVTTWGESEYAPNEARLMLCSLSSIAAFDVGDTDGGSSMSSYLERTGLAFDDAGSVKLIRSVRPRIDGMTGDVVQVQVGASMTPDAPPTWSNPVNFTIGSDIKADTFAQGRFLALRFSSSRPWRIRSLDLDVVATGAF